ncbi:MAG: WG repeat-containing protein [Cyanobacteria bacterium J06639_18]
MVAGCNSPFSQVDTSPVKDRYIISDYKTGKYGFINSEGKIVIEPKYSEIEDFSDGLALIKEKNENGKELYGYIDRNGQEVIKAQYKYAFSFSEGLASVSGVKDNEPPRKIFINTRGETAFELPSDVDKYNDSFKEGLLPVRINNRWGYIDKTGKMVIEPKYDEAWSFSQGLARVGIKTGKTEFTGWIAEPVVEIIAHGYIDKTGKFIIEPEYREAYHFSSEGLALVNKNGSWNDLQVIDKNNKVITKVSICGEKNYKGYSEGLLAARIDTGTFRRSCGFIDVKGETVIKPKFDEVLAFNEGLAGVKVGDKWGFIDKKGTIVIEPQYDTVDFFENGLALVEKKPLVPKAYINREGKYVWKNIEY